MRRGLVSLSATVAAIVAAGFSTPAVAAAPPDADVGGEYLLVRRVTSDDGWFGLPTIDATVNFMHEARTYDIAVVGDVVDGSADLSIRSRYFREDPQLATDSFRGELVDGAITFANVVNDACVNPATGEYDGPPEAQLTSTLDVAPSKIEGVFAGTFSYAAETAASDECEPEDIGYTADAWLIHEDAEWASPVAGIYAGQYASDQQLWQTEYAVRECAADEGCTLVVRYEQAVAEADGSTSQQFVDVFLLETGEGDYVGGAVYTAGCVSDLDGSFVADDVYEVRVRAFGSFYDIGGGERALVFYKEEIGDVAADADADVADRCGPIEDDHFFAGLPIAREADWSIKSVSTTG